MAQVFANSIQRAVNMANQKIGAAETRPFSPESLSRDELEKCIEFYFGCHPKYFYYEGGDKIKIDVYKIAMDGYDFRGLKQH